MVKRSVINPVNCFNKMRYNLRIIENAEFKDLTESLSLPERLEFASKISNKMNEMDKDGHRR